MISVSQKAAAGTFGRDVCVTAGAGSGKTSVLVNRFANAVTELGDAPDRILAITFTDKAANDMKSRLVRRFEELGRDADRRALETAYIGTIHAFCARLLRENPIEAGVDPAFKVLSQGESELLMAKALDAVFENEGVESDAWIGLLAERGEDCVRSAMLDLYGQFRALGEDEKLLMVRSAAGRKKIQTNILSRLTRTAAEIGRAPKNATEEVLLEASRRLREAFTREPLDWSVLEEVAEALTGARMAGRFRDDIEALREDVDEWRGVALQELFAPQKREFLRVFGKFREAYENQKRARATYDFDDLPFLAWKLLSGDSPQNQAVRERYRARFKHIFVDEFQDTSPLQARVVDLLRGKGNLFIVGDRQQSIYAFRHADPSLFSAYEKAAGRSITLAENYRSRRAVIEFANAFFSKEVFSQNDFCALTPARRFKLAGEGSVETIAVPYGGQTAAKDLDEARGIEAARVAERIRALVESRTAVEDGTAGGRPIRWGDIAVLMRSTTQAPLYERALARAGVPFYSIKSKSFFERPEVKDFIHFLNLLEHPDDDVSLAALLKSPMGGVSDDGLFWLSRAAKTAEADRPLSRALSDADEELPGISPSDRSSARRLHDFMTSVRSMKNGFTVSGLLEEAIRWSGYEVSMMASPGGGQRVANVRKLVEMARSLEEKTPVDASEFVRYARALAERDEAESEARVESEGGDAVLVSSIHAAKGLEFPCVFVVNLGGSKPFRTPSLAAASAEEGLGWSMPDKDGEPMRDRAYQRVLTSSKTKQDAEEARLFYVAVTRAQERLVLCGGLKGGSENGSRAKESWMPRVLSTLGNGEPEPGAGASVAADTAHRESRSLPDAAEILKRLNVPDKAYDLAIDLTVTDLLESTRAVSSLELEEEPGLPEPDDAERTPRNEFGTLFHKFMEIIAVSRPSKSARGRILETLSASLAEEEKREMESGARAFWESPLGASVLKSKRVYPELPFIYKTRHGILKGQIDLVFLDASGRWTIVDYKTNRISSDQKNKTAAKYAMQLELYALVFKKLFGEAPARGLLYFSTIAESAEFTYSPAGLDDVERRMDELFRNACLETP